MLALKPAHTRGPGAQWDLAITGAGADPQSPEQVAREKLPVFRYHDRRCHRRGAKYESQKLWLLRNMPLRSVAQV